MPAELSPDLRQALTANSGGPLEVIDPITKEAYVLVSAAAFQRIQALLGDDGDFVRDMSRLLVDLSPDDWEDSANYELPKP